MCFFLSQLFKKEKEELVVEVPNDVIVEEAWRQIYGELFDRYQEEVKDKEALRAQLTKLLYEESLDVEDLKDYYEGKYGNVTWLYRFDGKVYRDVKEVLKDTPAEAKKLRAFARSLIHEYELDSFSAPHLIVESVMQHFTDARNWSYVTDTKQFGMPEFWQKAGKSVETMKGDCDDLAILMHNTIYYILDETGQKFQYWRIKFDACNTLVEGHATNIFLADDGEWYMVESTLDLEGSLEKTWLKTPVRNNNLYKNFWGFARKDRSWKGNADSLLPRKNEGGV